MKVGFGRESITPSSTFNLDSKDLGDDGKLGSAVGSVVRALSQGVMALPFVMLEF